MKKFAICVVATGLVYLIANYYNVKRTIEITVLAGIMTAIFLVLWNAPPKHNENGPDDQIDDFRMGDGSHLP